MADDLVISMQHVGERFLEIRPKRATIAVAAALNTGSNVRAFAAALQRGGYATDPDYASKVSSIAGNISPHLATLEPALKSASARPINPMTGPL